MKKLIYFLGLGLLIGNQQIYAQQLCDDFSNPSDWTTITTTGTQRVFINSSSVVEFDDVIGKESFRIYRDLAPIGMTIGHYDNFKATIDFNPTHCNSNPPFIGVYPIALTNGNNEPLSSDWSIMPATPSAYDAVMVSYVTPNPAGAAYFDIRIKDSTDEKGSYGVSGLRIMAPLNVDYHIELERLCGGTYKLTVTNNTTSNLVGSFTWSYPDSTAIIDDLNHIQIGNAARGDINRNLTATADNFCLELFPGVGKPIFSGFNTTLPSGFDIDIYKCEGDTCFGFSVDPGLNNNLHQLLTSNFPAGANIYPTGINNEYQICWDPLGATPGSYTFTASAITDYCDTISQDYTINVQPGYNIGDSLTVCLNDPPFFLANPAPGGSWTVGSGPMMGQIIPGDIFDPKAFGPGVHTIYYCTPGMVPDPHQNPDDCNGCFPRVITVLWAAPPTSRSMNVGWLDNVVLGTDPNCTYTLSTVELLTGAVVAAPANSTQNMMSWLGFYNFVSGLDPSFTPAFNMVYNFIKSCPGENGCPELEYISVRVIESTGCYSTPTISIWSTATPSGQNHSYNLYSTISGTLTLDYSYWTLGTGSAPLHVLNWEAGSQPSPLFYDFTDPNNNIWPDIIDSCGLYDICLTTAFIFPYSELQPDGTLKWYDAVELCEECMEIYICDTPLDIQYDDGLETSDNGHSIQSALGINTESKDAQFMIFPNPSTGLITVVNPGGDQRIRVIDLTGKNLIEPFNTSANQIELDLDHLADGIYLIQLEHEGKILSKRIAVNK